MTIDEIKEKVNGPEYEFLKNDEHLGSNIILLGLARRTTKSKSRCFSEIEPQV